MSIAASQLTNMLQGSGTNLSRSVSSVGEHTSSSYHAVPVPKRAETFAGFDSNNSEKGKRGKNCIFDKLEVCMCMQN